MLSNARAAGLACRLQPRSAQGSGKHRDNAAAPPVAGFAPMGGAGAGRRCGGAIEIPGPHIGMLQFCRRPAPPLPPLPHPPPAFLGRPRPRHPLLIRLPQAEAATRRPAPPHYPDPPSDLFTPCSAWASCNAAFPPRTSLLPLHNTPSPLALAPPPVCLELGCIHGHISMVSSFAVSAHSERLHAMHVI